MRDLFVMINERSYQYLCAKKYVKKKYRQLYTYKCGF